MIRASLAQVNHFILQKNFLTAEEAPSVTDLVRRLVGLPADEPVTPFLASLARQPAFEADDLQARLEQLGNLIRAPLMRNTDYIVDTSQFAELHAATARQRNQAFNADFRSWGIQSNDDMENLGTAILDVVGDRPLTVEAVRERLPAGSVRELTQTSRGGRVTKSDTVSLALRWLVGRGLLALSYRSTDWRQASLTYARFESLYPRLDLTAAPDEAEAQTTVVRAYLAAFAPATEADISFWTGFGKSETARATGALSNETSLVMVDGMPGMLLMLKNQVDKLRATPVPPEPIVNVLPAEDPFTSAHRASRSRYFADPKFQRPTISSAGKSKPTILLNGQVVGLWNWRFEKSQNVIEWQLLTEVDSGVEALIRTEIAAVGSFIQPQVQLRQNRIS